MGYESERVAGNRWRLYTLQTHCADLSLSCVTRRYRECAATWRASSASSWLVPYRAASAACPASCAVHPLRLSHLVALAYLRSLPFHPSIDGSPYRINRGPDEQQRPYSLMTFKSVELDAVLNDHLWIWVARAPQGSIWQHELVYFRDLLLIAVQICNHKAVGIRRLAGTWRGFSAS